MEKSDAELELLRLLRGKDAVAFTLEISMLERQREPREVGPRGWRWLEKPGWTISMGVPDLRGKHLTTTGASFAEAWQRQALWWRQHAAAPDPLLRRDDRNRAASDSAERTETQFLTFIRGDIAGELTVTVSLKNGRWTTNVYVPGTVGHGTTGEGPSFAYAWNHDRPWWQE